MTITSPSSSGDAVGVTDVAMADLTELVRQEDVIKTPTTVKKLIS
jgi:hypothetical protein